MRPWIFALQPRRGKLRPKTRDFRFEAIDSREVGGELLTARSAMLVEMATTGEELAGAGVMRDLARIPRRDSRREGEGEGKGREMVGAVLPSNLLQGLRERGKAKKMRLPQGADLGR